MSEMLSKTLLRFVLASAFVSKSHGRAYWRAWPCDVLKGGFFMNKWFSALCVAIGAAASYLGQFLFGAN